MDLYDLRVIGYSMDRRQTSNLVIAALKDALKNRFTFIDCIIHSDNGCQYTSKKYKSYTKSKLLKVSYSKPHYPYDNAKAESFFALLKKEEVYRNKYYTIRKAKKKITGYINYYNNYRIHSSLGYLSPKEYYDLNYKRGTYKYVPFVIYDV